MISFPSMFGRVELIPRDSTDPSQVHSSDKTEHRSSFTFTAHDSHSDRNLRIRSTQSEKVTSDAKCLSQRLVGKRNSVRLSPPQQTSTAQTQYVSQEAGIFQIQDGMKELQQNTQRVRDIHARILSSVDSHDKNQELDQTMADVKKLASRIRFTLKEVQAEAERDMKENPTSAKSRLKQVQHQTLSKVRHMLSARSRLINIFRVGDLRPTFNS